MKIHMLPADHGDCLWVEYGAGRSLRRLLIDGGTAGTYKRLAENLRPLARRRFELFVTTHVDADHIEGVVKLLGDKKAKLDLGDLWFNGWRHLVEGSPKRTKPKDRLGPKQGEYLSAQIDRAGHPWNEAFGGKAVVVPNDGPLPRVKLAGKLVLTLLSPTRTRLDALTKEWKKKVEEEGLTPGDAERALAKLASDRKLKPRDLLGARLLDVAKLAAKKLKLDGTAPNGSSIAFLAEHGGRRVLFGADAHAPVLEGSLRRLLEERGEKRLAVDAFKLPHHGSKANLTPALLHLVRCKRFLVSTSGAQFKHPDAEALARVLAHAGPDVELHFNYRNKFTSPWDEPALRKKHGHRCFFPAAEGDGLTLEL